jgi:trimeric autotransporter adhesin
MYNSGNSSKNVTGASIVDGTVETVDIADDAVTADKLANSVNTDIATGVSGSTTANDALPKAGGTMTGNIIMGTNTIDGLAINSGASNNLGLGTSAVDAITTGTNNIGIGAQTLTVTDTGGYNTASGVDALRLNTSGGANTASGYGCMRGNLTGSNNTSSGVQALYTGSEASNNTAIGRSSMYWNTTGGSNSALGSNSLKGVTTGTQNVGVGYFAGSGTSTGSSNISIGYNAQVTTGTADNQLNIGGWIKKESASNNINLISGITFNGDTAADNALDDYEEGTWDPVINDLTTDATMNTSETQASYTKVGNVVTVQGWIQTSSMTGVTGNLNIKGLPFPVKSGNYGYSAVSIGQCFWLAITAGQSIAGKFEPATSYFTMVHWDHASGNTALQGGHWGAGAYMSFSGTYRV